MAKKYSINVEKDEIISVEVNGKKYRDPEQIPDLEDRAWIERMVCHFSAMGAGHAQSDASGFSKIMFPLFLGISILILLIFGISTTSAIRSVAREESAPGQVVDMVTRRDSSGTAYVYPVVEFSLPNGSRQRVELAEGTWPPAYAEGQHVTVKYDPDQPLNARLNSFSSGLAY